MASHVGAHSGDVVLFKGSGATGAINWMQYMLGLHESRSRSEKRPVVLLTHLEHHSNQTSWTDSNAIVRMVRPTSEDLPDPASSDDSNS